CEGAAMELLTSITRSCPRPVCTTPPHATGCAELWMDWDSTCRFSQRGWRCTTNRNDYSATTLMGNWNPKLLPSQVPPCAFPYCGNSKSQLG
uniref:Uncharacterized protein n=1 Tax=Falco tinnunculus TaxID=100819 RepID=A0A8C4UJW9_FALTI